MEPITHLEIQSNAKLTILSTGKLIVDGLSTFNAEIMLIGNINVEGGLEINKTALSAIKYLNGKT